MGSKPSGPPPPTTVLVDRYDYGVAMQKYQKDLAQWQKERDLAFKDWEARKEKELSETGERTETAGSFSFRPKPLEPQVDPNSPVFMPDPVSAGRTSRKSGAKRARRGGRVSTIFTSGLGG